MLISSLIVMCIVASLQFMHDFFLIQNTEYNKIIIHINLLSFDDFNVSYTTKKN